MKIRYFADDGTEFATEEECIKYEGGIVKLRCWNDKGELITNTTEMDYAFFCEIPTNTNSVLSVLSDFSLPEKEGRYIYWNEAWYTYEEFKEQCPFEKEKK